MKSAFCDRIICVPSDRTVDGLSQEHTALYELSAVDWTFKLFTPTFLGLDISIPSNLLDASEFIDGPRR
jgi:hypothetical protein